MQQKIKANTEIIALIKSAMQKLHINKEAQLCRFIPDSNGNGHIHHFTFKKMMLKEPQELMYLINHFVMHENKPTMMPIKQRIRKHKKGVLTGGKIQLGKFELCRVIELIREAGENKIAQKLLPYSASELSWSKKQIRHCIRNNLIIDLKLVEDYNTLTSMTKNDSNIVGNVLGQIL